jgi:hypothetical protein
LRNIHFIRMLVCKLLREFHFEKKQNYLFLIVISPFASALDVFVVMLILNVCCRGEIINEMILEINETYTQNTDTNESEEEREHRIAKILKNVIYQHVKVRNYISDIEAQFSFSFLVEFMSTSVVIGMGLNIIAVSKITNVYLLLISALVQLFVFCFFGNQLQLKSDQLLIETWNVKWYKMGIRNQKVWNSI